MVAGQIKSKERVAEHGEVFTPEHIVAAMLDLVEQETERIESRFLEPACGNGNFLVGGRCRRMEYERPQSVAFGKLQLSGPMLGRATAGIAYETMKNGVKQA